MTETPDNINAIPPPPEPVRKNRLTIIASLILFFGIGLFLGRYIIPVGEFNYGTLEFVAVDEGERRIIFPTFWQAWDALHSNFIGDLDEKDLFYGAITGMVRAADDPYTVFSPPVETKQFEETIQGSFSGVGIEIGVRNSVVTVISPLDGSPAKEAGIIAADIIIAIDQEPVTPDSTIDEVVQRIRGEKGEPVTLTVVHEGASQPTDIEIKRGMIEIESVKMNIADDIAFIEITSFNGDTAKRFSAAARDAKKSNVKGIVLDVRNNPGGFLQASVDMASVFLEKDTLVVSEQGKKSKEYLAEGSTTLADIPVVILVNGGSASASEILAGALHDQINAPIVGTTTFGKGSVQEFLKLDDGSSLRITVARWFTPNGRSIDEEGIEPTISVEQDRETEIDEQLERAKEEIIKLINGT